MKYLLSWVVSHLKNKNLSDIDTIENVINKLSTHTAEATLYATICYSDKEFAVGVIISNDDDLCLVHYNSEDKIIQLPPRPYGINGAQYIIVKEGDQYRFATTRDFYGEKNNYLPPIYGAIEDNIAYLAKKKKEIDYIIEIENTAINNRIDLFSHRGLARELAAIYDLALIPEKDLLYQKNTLSFKKNIFDIHTEAIISAVAVHVNCKEVYSHIDYLVSLSHLNITCHSFLIDLSNYVMFDIGQPLHIFDSGQIKKKLSFVDDIEANFIALDNTIVPIKSETIVITHNGLIKSLVGIMGGKDGAVSENTKSIIIESAAIDPQKVRQAVAKYGKKTDSSLRNERAAVPAGPMIALQRILYLLSEKHNIRIGDAQYFCKAEVIENLIISISVAYVNTIIGNEINQNYMQAILEKLGCKVIESIALFFSIEIPWWRQDLHNQDDIAEEIIRIIGFDKIDLHAPSLPCLYRQYDDKKFTLKNLTTLIANSDEVVVYGLDNAEISANWKYKPTKNIPLINGYSHIQKNLVQSNIPSLLHILYQIILKQTSLSYSIFTVSPIWEYDSHGKIREKKSYSILFYQEQYQNSFYDYKQKIEKIFYGLGVMLDFCAIQMHNIAHNLYSNIASIIFSHGVNIGHCGFINPINFHFATKKKGLVFACEIDISKILMEIQNRKNYEYFFDLSLMISDSMLSENVINLLYQGFGNIANITIIDWYQAAEWKDKKSVTLRIFTINANVGYEYQEIKKYLHAQGYVLR